MTPRVTVVIPNYCPTGQVGKYAHECIRSLASTILESAPIVFVDNGSSSDRTEMMVASLGSFFERFQFHHFPEPLGYARAVNFGMKFVETDYALILNNDIKFERPGSIEKLVELYQGTPFTGILAPQDGPGFEDVDLIYNQHWWSCVLMARDVWREVGELDEHKLNYRYHDQDWNIRCVKAGYHVARTGRVRVSHVNSATYRHMQVDESAEREEMIRRWGFAEFEQWMAKQSHESLVSKSRPA